MKELIVILIASIIFVGCHPEMEPVIFESRPTSTPPVPHKQVVSNSLPLVERWRWHGDVNIGGYFSPPAVKVNADRIIVAKREREEVRESVIAVDANTGKVIWETGDIENIKSLQAEDGRVYVGTIGFVRAFDIESGEKLWQGGEQSPSKKGRLVVYPKGKHLEVYDFDENLIYLLDSNTGQTLDRVSYPSIFFRYNNTNYSMTSGNHDLEATVESTGETLWSRDFEGFIYLWPAFINDTMLINAGGKLFAVDTKNGNINWQTPDSDFITGVTLGDSLAYAIRQDAAIVGFDSGTGEQVGTIEMSPHRTREDDGGYVKHYAIDASEEYVAVYYGNSQELILFEKLMK